MRRRDLLERLPSVYGFPQAVVQDPHGVGVHRIGEDVLVVPGSALEVPVVREQLPCFAVIV